MSVLLRCGLAKRCAGGPVGCEASRACVGPPVRADATHFPSTRRLRSAWAMTPDLFIRTWQGNTRNEAAGEFADLAGRLRSRGHAPDMVAHFVNRLVFCVFADDVGLLPDRLLAGMLTFATKAPANFAGAASELFRAMWTRATAGSTRPNWWTSRPMTRSGDCWH